MAQLEFDDAGARHIERTYGTPDVVRQRAQMLHLLGAQPGERVVDIGSGTGYLLASIADAVGPTGAVHGVDPSAAMNALAAARTADRPWVQVDEGHALDVPCPDGSLDAAVSTQVYEYVPDVPAALVELRRVLRPGGRALVLDTDWDSVVWHVADRERHARVMAAWEEHLAHPRLPRTLAGMVRRVGFAVAGQRVKAHDRRLRYLSCTGAALAPQTLIMAGQEPAARSDSHSPPPVSGPADSARRTRPVTTASVGSPE